MLPRDLTKELKDRLSTIRGQIEGLTKMLDESDDPAQILNQFKAVSQGFQKAEHLLLDEVFRKSLAIRIAMALETCPGNCGQEEKIDSIRKQFPGLNLYELTDKMKEMESIYSFLEEKTNKPMKEANFKIENMVCQGCAEKIDDTLKEVEGVKKVKTQVHKKAVIIEYDPASTDEDLLRTILTKEGYKPQDD